MVGWRWGNVTFNIHSICVNQIYFQIFARFCQIVPNNNSYRLTERKKIDFVKKSLPKIGPLFSVLNGSYWKKRPGPNFTILDFSLPLIIRVLSQRTYVYYLAITFYNDQCPKMIINYEDHNISLALVDDLLTRTTQIVLDPDEGRVQNFSFSKNSWAN